MKKQNKTKLLSILLLIMFLGIGYAMLTSNLKINGILKIQNNNFEIKFSNIVEKSGSVTPIKTATIDNDSSISFDVILEKPGDYYAFNVDVVNSGTLSAEIKSFEKTLLTEEQQKYLEYDVSYSNGYGINIGDMLPRKTTKTINVLVSYKESPEEFPETSTQTLSFYFSVDYMEAQVSNKYEGKVVSILGDSISTLKGYIPEGNRARYVQTEAEATGGLLYMPYNETWWGQVINSNNMVLGINDSWAGSTVSNTSNTDSGDVGPNRAMASMTRVEKLDDNGTPDLILFYGGTNDIGRDITIGTFDKNASYVTKLDTTSTTYNSFVEAYTIAILRMKHLYPDAEIVSLLPTYTTTYYTSDELELYNAEMIKVCKYFGIKYIDLRNSGLTTSHLADGIHPNATGMDLLSSYIIERLNSNNLSEPDNNINNVESAERITANEHAQELPTNLTSETNLYTALTPRDGYYDATSYTQQESITIVSVVIPVVPGDKIKANSFNEVNPTNPGVMGIRVTFLKDNNVVGSKTPSEIYNEYLANGYITVPEGVNAVCIPWWGASDSNWAYLIVD